MTTETADKLYYRIGEVEAITRVPAYVLRYWESEFKLLRPKKNPAGQRVYRKRDLELTPEALDLLTEYDWPGNVRELENVIERAVVLSPGNIIGVELIPDHVRKAPNFQMPQFVVPPEGISFKDVITDFEKRLIESTLEAAGGVQKRAAELLHIKPTTLNEMLKRYDIISLDDLQAVTGGASMMITRAA